MSSPPTRRYLVTGGRGFIGRHLLSRLVAQGAEVHATTRSATPPTESDIAPHVRWWRVDLADAAATEELVTRLQPDVVIHLAGRADGTRRLDAVVPILTDTLLTTVSVLAAAARLPRSKVVVAGSVEDGDHQPDVHSPYAASKAAAATYASLFHGLWQLDVTVLRLAMVYGPDDPNAHRLIPSVVAAFADGRRPAVSSGTRRIDWVFVDDVVDAFLAAADGGCGVYDIGSGTLVSIRDTVRMVAAAMGTAIAPAFGAVGDRPLERELRADPKPALAALGWRHRACGRHCPGGFRLSWG
jgi:nucleoside-diphosphate-sugar epimerase